MTAQLVLIAAILILGGVIATVGDRLGMRVGKARLTLFNLRPRQTATLITILTGTVISASTFALLFALSEQLRRGIFDFEEIQENLNRARQDLEETSAQKEEVETELSRARTQQNEAQRRLRRINQSLEAAVARQARTQRQLQNTQAQLGQTERRLNQVASSFRTAQAQLTRVTQQAEGLRGEIQQLQSERQQLIRQRDEEVAQRDRAIAERETQLRDLESQRAGLAEEVSLLEEQRIALEREIQRLRQGNVAILRNQPLASGVVRVVTPNAAPLAVDQLLREANRVAIQRLIPDASDFNQQVINISSTEVERLIEQIDDGQDYVVRILSAGNYVVGEPCITAGESCIRVFADAAPNQVVFIANEIITSSAINPEMLTNEELIDRVYLLIAATQFRVRQAGVLTDNIQIADGQAETVSNFLRQIRQYNQPIEVQAVAADITYTAGPVRIELVAVQNGQVLFGTN